jgi:hypothetical protein
MALAFASTPAPAPLGSRRRAVPVRPARPLPPVRPARPAPSGPAPAPGTAGSRRHLPSGHGRCPGQARRPSAVVRRRRLLLAAVTVALLTALALPWSGAGGRPLATPGPALAGALAPHAAYIVQPGDTLWSIALRLDPSGDPRPLVQRLEQQVGGDTVQPGERVVLP